MTIEEAMRYYTLNGVQARVAAAGELIKSPEKESREFFLGIYRS